jgi:hypothetical protein
MVLLAVADGLALEEVELELGAAYELGASDEVDASAGAT